MDITYEDIIRIAKECSSKSELLKKFNKEHRTFWLDKILKKNNIDDITVFFKPQPHKYSHILHFCEKCNNKIEIKFKSDINKRFCCISCSSSREHSAESKQKASNSIKIFRSTLTAEDEKKMTFGGKSIKELIDIRKRNSEASKESKFNQKMERILTSKFSCLSINEKRIFLMNKQSCKCSICGCLDWNNKPITFELDHISGIRSDESEDNLRLICPNCHSQTDTYKGKNVKNKISDETIKEAINSSSSIYGVLQKCNMNLHGNNYKRIRDIMSKFNLDFYRI